MRPNSIAARKIGERRAAFRVERDDFGDKDDVIARAMAIDNLAIEPREAVFQNRRTGLPDFIFVRRKRARLMACEPFGYGLLGAGQAVISKCA